MGEDWRARRRGARRHRGRAQADPFAVLGPHETAGGMGHPGLRARGDLGARARPAMASSWPSCARRKDDFFEALIPSAKERPAYRVEVETAHGTYSYIDPYASGRCSGRSTITGCARARIASSTTGSAPSSSPTRASTACSSRSGRRMRRAFRSSATSTTGTAGAARCASASTAACGRSSSPNLTVGAVYKFEILGRTARCCR